MTSLNYAMLGKYSDASVIESRIFHGQTTSKYFAQILLNASAPWCWINKGHVFVAFRL